MKRFLPLVQGAALLLLLVVAYAFYALPPEKPRILVFSKTAGFKHESIPDGIVAIRKLGSQNNFDVDTTSNADLFTQDSLKKYAAVVFLSTTGDFLNQYQEAEFERYIQAGGGYVGIHAAADGEYEWGWYGRLAGGYFLTHPGIRDTFRNVQQGVLTITDQTNPATAQLPKQWTKTDEFYSFKNLNPDVKVLMTLDESTYHVGVKMDTHPMTWYHEYDGGRAFYTALGHTKETFQEEPYLKLLLGGIQYAIGTNISLDYSKAKTAQVPDENRFEKKQLVSGTFFEPTEMTVLPNKDVLVAQRRGELMLYKNNSKTVKQAGFLNVYFKTHTPGVNAEEGVLGLKADPNFEKNHYVFVFYSPVDTSVNRLSRFKLENDKLDMKSEKVVLQFFSQREICCHTGGSIAFDKEGLLYLSAGDNSTPFNEAKQAYGSNGFAPLDDRPGHEQFDARRTAGNPNDLRGKIMRIRVNEDGSYDIPEGNLYPKGTPGTRPEIYVQGNRNPYRISVDQKNGYLYWGEVGPDANNDSLDNRGPRGYDEINQARKAGNFGWPLFVGNNYAYRPFDYGTGTSSAAFDPQHPINKSRNNTGMQELPPAQPAFIWYPYAASPDFPQVGTGGRNAMAGPVYYTDLYPKETRLPDYYNNKLIIYDWIRGWMKAVTLKPNGDFDKMEPFMEHTKLHNVIDMEVGPDGKLYLLEYGSGWFSKNDDAGLARIDYNGGNRAPVINELQVNKRSGALPFKLVATVAAADPERDPLTYEWYIGSGIKKVTHEPKLEYTFAKRGDYPVRVVVKDTKNATAKSNYVSVYAGNEAPQVKIALKGNKSFYFPDKPVAYAVSVSDKEDASAAKDVKNAFVSADYVEGMDKAGASMGHQIVSEAMIGKSLVQSLDCKSCHKQNEKSIGPSFVAVSKRYQKSATAESHLVNKIIKGGAGVWGEVAMPAHPTLKPSDAKQIVTWVRSLSETAAKQKSLPTTGTVKPTLEKKATDDGILVLTASYTDKGGAGIKPMMGSNSVALRSAKVDLKNTKHVNGFNSMTYGSMFLMIAPKDKGSFAIDSIDLTDITSIELAVGWDKQPRFGYTIEVRLDSPEGKKIGEATINGSTDETRSAAGYGGTQLQVALQPVTDRQFHAVYIISNIANTAEQSSLFLRGMRFKAK